MKIIVAGIPRSGTTYFFRSLNNLPQSPISPDFDKIEDHAHYLNDTIKLHTPYNTLPLNEDYKVIFLHRELKDSLVSNTLIFNNDIPHFRNVGSEYNGFLTDVIFEQDILNLESIFDTWVTHAKYPTLVLKYETLPDYFKEIEAFLGRSISFLPFNLSPSKILPEEHQDKFYNTYKGLINKLNLLSNIHYINV